MTHQVLERLDAELSNSDKAGPPNALKKLAPFAERENPS
jgi:hypothetical protein